MIKKIKRALFFIKTWGFNVFVKECIDRIADHYYETYFNIETTGYITTEQLKNLINSKNSSALIEIDGGVNENNFEKLKKLGADVLVAGSYVFNSSDYNAAIDLIK